jgi:flagellar motor switch protein FliN
MVNDYIDCWFSAAKALFAQALDEQAEFAESSPQQPGARPIGFAARLQGSKMGRFTVLLDPAMLKASVLTGVVDQKAGWGELLREVADAAAGELLARTGEKCEVVEFREVGEETRGSRAFHLRLPAGGWTLLVRDELTSQSSRSIRGVCDPASRDGSDHFAVPSTGIELLLDVELDATIRFGCREISLSEVLELGPGDVVELDRHAADPVDLIVGDKVVAHGEVVLVNGNFGLRVTEVAMPRKRLESIRCLF